VTESFLQLFRSLTDFGQLACGQHAEIVAFAVFWPGWIAEFRNSELVSVHFSGRNWCQFILSGRNWCQFILGNWTG
jgi:hypothetical protein